MDGVVATERELVRQGGCAVEDVLVHFGDVVLCGYLMGGFLMTACR